MTACEHAGCKTPAHSFVRWGADSRQCGNLCEEHLRLVWDSAQSQIAVGICWWEEGPPKDRGAYKP